MNFFSIKQYPIIFIFFTFLSIKINADGINDYFLNETSEQLVYIEKNLNKQDIEEVIFQ